MCRLLLASKDAVIRYERKYGFLSLLDYLENQMGGDGNGIALTRNTEVYRLLKGQKLTNKRIATIALEEEYDWLVYHTRIQTFGSVRSENCHPFVNDRGWVLAMNGSEYQFGDMGEIVDKTDSEMIFYLVSQFKTDDAIDMLSSLDSVFVGVFNGKPLAIVNSGTLMKWNDKTTLYASSFPKKAKATLLPFGYRYVDGGIDVPDKPRTRYDYRYGYTPLHSRTSLPYEEEYFLGYEDGYTEGYDKGFIDGTSDQ